MLNLHDKSAASLKKLLLHFTLLFGFVPAMAQTYQGDEIYATVNSLRDLDFGFAYKYSLKEDLFLRLDLLNASVSSKKHENYNMVSPSGNLLNVTEQKDSNYQLGVGIEKRKPFNKTVSFLYGVSAIGGRTGQITEAITADDKVLTNIKYGSWSYGGGVHLGVLIKLADHFLVGGELLPKYLISQEKMEYIASSSISNQVQKTTTQSFGLSMNDVRLSLVYRLSR